MQCADAQRLDAGVASSVQALDAFDLGTTLVAGMVLPWTGVVEEGNCRDSEAEFVIVSNHCRLSQIAANIQTRT